MNCSLRRCNFDTTIGNCTEFCKNEFPNRIRQLKTFGETLKGVAKILVESVEKRITQEIKLNNSNITVECLVPKGVVHDESDTIILWESTKELNFESNLSKLIDLSDRYLYVPFYVNLKIWFDVEENEDIGKFSEEIVKTNLNLPSNMVPLWKLKIEDRVCLILNAILLLNKPVQLIENICDVEIPVEEAIQIEMDGKLICTKFDNFINHMEYCSRSRDIETFKISKDDSGDVSELCFPPELKYPERTIFSLIELEDVNAKDIYDINRFDRIIFHIKDENGVSKSGVTIPRENAIKELYVYTSLYYECNKKNKEGKPILEYKDYYGIDPHYFSIRTHYGNIIVPYNQHSKLKNYKVVEYELVKRKNKSLPLRSRSSALNEEDADVSGLHCGPNSIMDVYDLKEIQPVRQRYMFGNNYNFVTKCIKDYGVRKYKVIKYLDDIVFMIPYNLTDSQSKYLTRIFIATRTQSTIYQAHGSFYLKRKYVDRLIEIWNNGDLSKYPQEEKDINENVYIWHWNGEYENESQFIKELSDEVESILKDSILKTGIKNLSEVRIELTSIFDSLIPRKYDSLINKMIHKYKMKSTYYIKQKIVTEIFDIIVLETTSFDVIKKFIEDNLKTVINANLVPNWNEMINEIANFFTNFAKYIYDNIDKDPKEIYTTFLQENPKVLGINWYNESGRITGEFYENYLQFSIPYMKELKLENELYYKYLTQDMINKVEKIIDGKKNWKELKSSLHNLINNYQSYYQQQTIKLYIKAVIKNLEKIKQIVSNIVEEYKDSSDDRKEYDELKEAIDLYVSEISNDRIREIFKNDYKDILMFISTEVWRTDILKSYNQQNQRNRRRGQREEESETEEPNLARRLF